MTPHDLTEEQQKFVRKFFNHVAEYADSIRSFHELGEEGLAHIEEAEAAHYVYASEEWMKGKGVPEEVIDAVWSCFSPKTPSAEVFPTQGLDRAFPYIDIQA